ncbi:MAG TPA: Glu/Leu/Phe/Val dehydrogenase dimerization domain-containing protein [Terriglobales bacterium]|nr:Glu/Leu/Phe/Val dehydrogenase dimerization domain-containing protein [Terriglobales bacterium]
MQISGLAIAGYERVLRVEDEGSGYRAVIAIHNTALGPAVGGTRLWKYADLEAALEDALRLARGMTYKNALAGLPFGGGKSVLLVPEGAYDREELFRVHGRVVESLGGTYITAEDVGTSTDDMEIVRRETKHVGGLKGASGDPSPRTARGVFRAMQAAARWKWGSDDLRGKTVAIQGCGHVGSSLASQLAQAGAQVVVSDIDRKRAAAAAQECSGKVVESAEIYGVAADVFAPCALGGVLNDETIAQLKVEMVVGAANNQLLDPQHGRKLQERGILYAPDYAANAGGVINGCCLELLGWDLAATMRKIDAIYDTMLGIFELAKGKDTTPAEAADRLAEKRFRPVANQGSAS